MGPGLGKKGMGAPWRRGYLESTKILETIGSFHLQIKLERLDLHGTTQHSDFT